jgi:hypothetical protein
MKKIKYFFWLCSGAHRDILEKCPTESSKYVGIGATVFFTGVFAALAGAYALYTVFENYWTSIAFGLIWGLMIFNLDRFIVSSMRKTGNIRKEFYMAIPRLILAILISLVIAKPLEMKIFEKEIQSEFKLMERKQYTNNINEIKSKYRQEQESIQSEINLFKSEINEKTLKRDELRRLAQEEADGTGGSMRRNAGPIYQIKKADADRVEQELNDLLSINESLIADKQNRLKEIEELITLEISAVQRTGIPGPAARLDALSNLTNKSSAIWLANWFIILLFIAVETAPVVVKLISPRGPYDRVLQIDERSFETMMYEEIAKQNKGIRAKTKKYPDLEKKYVEDKLETSLSRT